jgi:acetyltransferase-like isoleucine patch superfamily enzyme
MKDEIRTATKVKPKNDNQMIRLGEGAIIDDSVILGYLPARGMHLTLQIGTAAHIRSGTVIYGGSRIGCNLDTGHNVVIREENEIGDNFRIWNNSIIDHSCRIGNNVKVHAKVYVAQFTVIEDDVFLAPGVTTANILHPGCPDAAECLHGPTIKTGAQIGINATILPLVVIGENSLIGAGSVVTKDIPPGVVAYGNPAQVICGIGDLTCSTGLRDKPYNDSYLGRK